MTYKEETMALASDRAKEIATKFVEEVAGLLAGDNIDPNDHHRGILFGVALENIADLFIGRRTGNRTYRSMKRLERGQTR